MSSETMTVNLPLPKISLDFTSSFAYNGDGLLYCAECDLWLSNRTKDCQKILLSCYDTASLTLIKTAEDWIDGAVRGCFLCDLVRAVVGEIGRDRGVANALQLRSHGRGNHLVLLSGHLGESAEDIAREELWTAEVFSLDDRNAPLPFLPEAHPLPKDFGSEDCLHRARSWLQKCKGSHSEWCQRTSANPRLPTRILDITSVSPILVVTNGEHHEFAALSHCWGSAGNEPPRTTTSNIDLHKTTGVSAASLSATYRDAITVARYLGFQYLWIDSLCIIQDDPQDWDHESGQMAGVYGDADIVLGATSAINGSKGFLVKRPDYIDGIVKASHGSIGSSLRWSACYRSHLHHKPHRASREACRPTYEGPLESRAWAYQERIMARRFLSFGTHEMLWECNSILECECLHFNGLAGDTKEGEPVHRKYNLQRKLHQDEPRVFDSLHGTWRKNVVMHYTNRKLTKSSDRLVALSAIASEFSKRLSDQYLAGLWKGDLKRDLLWLCKEGQSKIIAGTPSWSWASVEGGISWVRGRLELMQDLEFVGIVYATAGDNEFGAPSVASIAFRGLVIGGRHLVCQPDQGSNRGLKGETRSRMSLPRGKTCNVFLDTYLELTEITGADGCSVLSARRRQKDTQLGGEKKQQAITYEGLVCLYLGSDWALILGPTTCGVDGPFERLGICHLPHPKIQGWARRQIMVV